MEDKRLVMCTSTGCIEYGPEKYRQLGIEFFHIAVNYEGKDYLEGVDLNPWDFFKREATISDPKNNLPHSAIPSMGQIRAQFESIVKRGYKEVIIVTLSSYLGGTFNAIQLVGQEFEEQLKITMIDSLTTCFCEGMIAIQAAELVQKGVPTETIVKELKWSIAHEEFIGVCGKLDYLVYNGRLKGGKAFMGKLLQITPVMHFSREGVLEPFAQTVGLKAGVVKSIQEVLKCIGNRDPKDYYLWHNYTGEHSADIYKEVEEQYGLHCNHEDVIGSPVTGCHTGPYLAGYGLFMKRREDEPLE